MPFWAWSNALLGVVWGPANLNHNGGPRSTIFILGGAALALTVLIKGTCLSWKTAQTIKNNMKFWAAFIPHLSIRANHCCILWWTQSQMWYAWSLCTSRDSPSLPPKCANTISTPLVNLLSRSLGPPHVLGRKHSNETNTSFVVLFSQFHSSHHFTWSTNTSLVLKYRSQIKRSQDFHFCLCHCPFFLCVLQS